MQSNLEHITFHCLKVRIIQKVSEDTCPKNGTWKNSNLFNKCGGWNKLASGGGAKVVKSLNVEVGINVEGGIFWKKTST